MTAADSVIFTIGHSTRTLQELIEALRAHGVQTVADVRITPKSRRLPHFNIESLQVELPRHGIAYRHFKPLGGHRKPRRDSINAAWRTEGFRGYADYMQTSDFEKAIDSLLDTARQSPTAIMCAEAVPWRCHRSLIADALLVRGWKVVHILGRDDARPHALPAFARTEGERVTYPAETLFTHEHSPH